MSKSPPPGPASDGTSRRLLARVTCPHCWHRFAPEDVLWVAEHSELSRDPVVGDAPLRFFPTRFSPQGYALDPRGEVCRKLACPRCHLGVPRELLEVEPLFVSITGDQACGKSFLLTSMVQQLREALFHDFCIKFRDADPVSNSVLTGYIESLFGRADNESPVPLGDLIPKTPMGGDLYVPVRLGGQVISYPKPFVFAMQPTSLHPASDDARLSRMLCLYDNAGEHFRPGAHRVTNPCADHLALSKAILFLFDPSQDRNFRAQCRGETQSRTGGLAPAQQITILSEVARRVRDHAGLASHEPYGRPLVVVLTKFDAWSHLLGESEAPDPWLRPGRPGPCALAIDRVLELSGSLRALMLRYCPDIVAAAEGFAREVVYIAASALASPNDRGRLLVDARSRAVCIRPKDVRPYWAAVPLLYVISRTVPGLIPRVSPNGRVAAAAHGAKERP